MGRAFCHTKEFLIFRIPDPSGTLQVNQNLMLAIINIQTRNYFIRQPVPPDRGHELPGPFLEVRGWKSRLAAAVDHIQRAAAGFFDVAGKV